MPRPSREKKHTHKHTGNRAFRWKMSGAVGGHQMVFLNEDLASLSHAGGCRHQFGLTQTFPCETRGSCFPILPFLNVLDDQALLNVPPSSTCHSVMLRARKRKTTSRLVDLLEGLQTQLSCWSLRYDEKRKPSRVLGRRAVRTQKKAAWNSSARCTPDRTRSAHLA